MKTIWKFPLQVTNDQILQMPHGAEILCVQVQGDNNAPCLWAIVEDTKFTYPRTIHMYGTGHKLASHPGRFISTFQMDGGRLVFHVFEPPQEVSCTTST
jgi:hypothetical protein